MADVTTSSFPQVVPTDDDQAVLVRSPGAGGSDVRAPLGSIMGPVVTEPEAEAGSSSAVRRWSPLRLAQAISALGAAGPQGPQGAQGIPGADGTDGADGAQGDTGPQGATGDQGPAGLDGADGLDGAQGPQGDTGPQGVQGPQGATGAAGSDGSDGAQGPQGNTGPQGAMGAAGSDGADGAQGPQGVTGPQGATGAPGAQGPAGSDGADGAQGPQGDTGPPGSTVANGVSFTPAADIAATDVQAAIEEVASKRATPALVAQTLPRTTWAADRFYYSGLIGVWGTLLNQTLGGSGTILAYPVFIPDDYEVSKLACQIEQSAVGGNVRLALYTDADGAPDSLVVDSGDIDASSTGKKAVVVSAAATRGWHWLAVRSSASGIQFRAVDNLNLGTMLGDGDGVGNLGGSSSSGWTMAGTYGAFPTTFVAGGTTTAEMVVIGIQRSA